MSIEYDSSREERIKAAIRLDTAILSASGKINHADQTFTFSLETIQVFLNNTIRRAVALGEALKEEEMREPQPYEDNRPAFLRKIMD